MNILSGRLATAGNSIYRRINFAAVRTRHMEKNTKRPVKGSPNPVKHARCWVFERGPGRWLFWDGIFGSPWPFAEKKVFLSYTSHNLFRLPSPRTSNPYSQPTRTAQTQLFFRDTVGLLGFFTLFHCLYFFRWVSLVKMLSSARAPLCQEIGWAAILDFPVEPPVGTFNAFTFPGSSGDGSVFGRTQRDERKFFVYRVDVKVQQNRKFVVGMLSGTKM